MSVQAVRSLVVLALLACAGPVASPEAPRSSVLSLAVGESSLLDGLAIRVSDSSATRVFGRDDFTVHERRTEKFPVAAAGALSVRITLTHDGEIVADGRADLDVAPDETLFVRVSRHDFDPLSGFCYHCVASLAIPIDPGCRRTPGERLWVTWGRLG